MYEALPDKRPDTRMRDIGAFNRENIQRLLPALSLYPLTQHLHMSQEQFQTLTMQAQQEASNPSLKPYFPLYVTSLRSNFIQLSDHSGMSASVENHEGCFKIEGNLRQVGFQRGTGTQSSWPEGESWGPVGLARRMLCSLQTGCCFIWNSLPGL